MSDLIEALQIFLKYGNPKYPTYCSHDKLQVYIEPKIVSEEDMIKLKELGFCPDDEEEYFYSYRFGSC